MRIIRMFAVAVLLFAAMAAPSPAQDKAGIVPIAKTKFSALDGLPACMTLSAQRGDPFKGPAVILIKMTAGCTIPWHWHTANESLMIVGGKGKIEMKDAAAQALVSGDFVFLPSKHHHQFTCIAACTFFDVTDAAFDIHYIDKDGKEIPPAEALKAPAKKPAAPAAKKKG
jgi:quercetin dioxygenase-like cupin family protein